MSNIKQLGKLGKLMAGKKPGPESAAPPPVNQGGGYSNKHKKIKTTNKNVVRSFPQFKVVA